MILVQRVIEFLKIPTQLNSACWQLVSLGFTIQVKSIFYWCGSAEVGEGAAPGLGKSALPSRPNTNN